MISVWWLYCNRLLSLWLINHIIQHNTKGPFTLQEMNDLKNIFFKNDQLYRL